MGDGNDYEMFGWALIQIDEFGKIKKGRYQAKILNPPAY